MFNKETFEFITQSPAGMSLVIFAAVVMSLAASSLITHRKRS